MFRVAKSRQADAKDQLTMRQKTPSFDKSTRLIFLALLLICELIGTRCIASGRNSEIQVIHNDIYLKEPTGDWRRLTRDGKPKENAILSPSGRQVAYNRPWTAYGKEPKPPVFVVLSTETGTILREIPVDWVARYIDNAAWIDDRFLMVSGEGIFFVVLDTHGGEQTHSLFGGGFSLSPDRNKTVFVKGRLPLYGNTPPQYESDELMPALISPKVHGGELRVSSRRFQLAKILGNIGEIVWLDVNGSIRVSTANATFSVDLKTSQVHKVAPT